MVRFRERSPLQLLVKRQSNIEEFFPGAIPEMFSSCGATHKCLFFPIKSFHP
ncbi:MAG: hypothetical protein F6K24_19795 [Okeania sp. SIO2D1]|nr:hypothetical protein [Okeania sp. SIO2D1]